MRTLAILTTLFSAVCGCDDRNAKSVAPRPAVRQPAGLAAAQEKLERLAQGTAEAECGPDAAARIRAVARMLDENGVEPLEGKIFPICAMLRQPSEYDPPGMDGLMVTSLNGGSGRIESIEFLDADGSRIGRSPVKRGADVLAVGLEFSTLFVYLTPSAFAATQPANPDLVKAGEIEGYPIAVVTKPPKAIRLKHENGSMSETIPILRSSFDQKTGEPVRGEG